jgi:hypothetical protein
MKKAYFGCLIFVLLLFISKNGYTIKYAPSITPNGVGYSDVRFDNNVFSVKFVGDNSTTDDELVDFINIRAAEIALQHNFSYFIIRDYYFNYTKHKGRVTIECFKKEPILDEIFLENTTLLQKYNARLTYDSLSKVYNLHKKHN